MLGTQSYTQEIPKNPLKISIRTNKQIKEACRVKDQYVKIIFLIQTINKLS